MGNVLVNLIEIAFSIKVKLTPQKVPSLSVDMEYNLGMTVTLYGIFDNERLVDSCFLRDGKKIEE